MHQITDLFKQWRTGDSGAGKELAQRFSDWYFTLTSARLGERVGREPLEAACSTFVQGIITVSKPRDLAPWAHGIVRKTVSEAGGRVAPGDYPSTITQRQSPTALLRKARNGLDRRDVRLLAMAYGSTASLDELTRTAEERGGMPYAVLEARCGLKRWLHDHAEIPFRILQDTPDPDWSPIPIYESARMTSDEEETAFETWLLHDPRAGRDVGEFAPFSHALRAGAFAETHTGEAVPLPEESGIVLPPVTQHPSTQAFASARRPHTALPPTASRERTVMAAVAVFAVVAILGIWRILGS
jgi:hypothetical protein